MLALPMTVVYAVGYSIIKYQEGWADIPGLGGESTVYFNSIL